MSFFMLAFDYLLFYESYFFELCQDMLTALSYGYKFHYQPKFDQLTEQLEIEFFYTKLLILQEKEIIDIHNNLADLLRAEANNPIKNYRRVVGL